MDENRSGVLEHHQGKDSEMACQGGTKSAQAIEVTREREQS